MKIRHTVVFTFHDSITENQIDEVIALINKMGEYSTEKLRVTDWIVTKHIPETIKPRRAHLLQDGIFPNLEALQKHGETEIHKRVIESAQKVCDWMAIDTLIPENY